MVCSSIMLFSVPSQLLQRKEFAAEVSTKSSKCKLNASCNSAFNASLAPLHAAPCSFFLLFFSCPEETEDLHKQQSSIAKIACRLINAPQLIRAVAMNHNQPHADSAETNCPTSVYQTLFSWKRVWLRETRRARSFLLVFKNKIERRGRQNENRPINLLNGITFSTYFKYTTQS